MTKASPEIEAKAAARLARDVARLESGPGGRRTSQSLGQAARAFVRHPSPWLIGSALVGGVGRPRPRAPVLVDRAAGAGRAGGAVPGDRVGGPRVHPALAGRGSLGPVAVDSLLARKHRAHHADPRDLPLVFIPWQVELWLLPSYVVVALVVFPGRAAGAQLPGRRRPR